MTKFKFWMSFLLCSSLLLFTFNNCGTGYETIESFHEEAPELDFKPASDEHTLLMGDMMVEEEVLEKLEDSEPSPYSVGENAAGRDLSDFGARYWPQGIIPIVFEKGYTAAQKNLVWSACKKWADVADVSCVPYKSTIHGANNYLFVTKQDRGAQGVGEGGCWAHFGRPKNGPAYMNLDPSLPVDPTLPHGTCFEPGIILHELGHVLGMIHEQNRPDRDKFIAFNKNNANTKDTSCISNLMLKFRTDQVVKLSADYDYNSIMHYSELHCSVNGKPTMIPLKSMGKNRLGDAVLKTAKISPTDAQWVRKVYGL